MRRRRQKVYGVLDLLKPNRRFNLLANSDYDRDLVPALLDCKPYDRKKQGIINTATSIVKNIFVKPKAPDYVIDVTGSPPGYTRTTTGSLVPTPGTTGTPGYRGGGGGGGGSGVALTPSSAGGISQQDIERQRLLELEAQRKALEAQQAAEAQQKAQQEAIKAGTIGGQIESKVKITPAGAVSVTSPTGKTTTYTGTAIVPEYGISAGVLSRQTAAEAASRGEISIQDIGRTSFSGSIFGERIVAPQMSQGIMEKSVAPISSQGIMEKSVAPISTTEKTNLFSSLFSKGIIGFPGSTLLFKEKRKELQQKIQKVKEAGVSDFLFGESGKPFIGIGLPGSLLPTFTAAEIQAGLRTKGIAGKVAGELIPTTPGAVALTAGFIGAVKYVPPIIRVGAEAYFAYTGGKSALDVSLPVEKRTIGGAVAGLSILGLGYEASPFVKGAVSKLSLKYRGVQEIEGIKMISKVPSVKVSEPFDIKLIPEAAPLGTGKATAGLPAYKKGGFGFTLAEQKAYIGKTGQVTTSARDLFGLGKSKVPIDTSKDPLGLYATPFPIKEPRVAQTRVSRLGLTSLKDLFKIPGAEAEISFKATKPQIVVFEQAKITKTGKPGTFRAVGKPSTELEVTATGRIKSKGKIGVTTISGQGVDIFSAELLPGKKPITQTEIIKAFSKTKGFSVSSARGVQTIPISSVLSPSIFTTSYLKGTSTRATKKISYDVIPTARATYPSKKKSPPFYPTRRISPPTYPTYPTTRATTPIYPARVTTPPYTPTRRYIPQKPISPPFAPSKLNIRFKEKSKRPPQYGKQPTRYQPSFTASALNIHIKKIPEFGGALQVRGIVDSKAYKRMKHARLI